MAKVKHAVVRTDLLAGTDVRSELASVRYQGVNSTTNETEYYEIDNGCFLKLGDLETDSRTVFKGEEPTASDALTDVVLVCNPEVMYDERLNSLDDYYNEAGKIVRGYRLHENDIFSVTAEALDGTPAVGKIVELQADTKGKVVSSATNGSTVIGEIIDKNIVGRFTYWVIEVQ